MGGNTIYGEYYAGLIDEVRVYNRALSATEIQADMNLPVGNVDTQAPSAPSSLAATGSITGAQLSWSPSTDNVGVVRYNVHRSTTSGFTPSAANRIAQPTGTSYTDTTAAGTYFYKVIAEDAAGNVGPASNEAGATITGDTQAPSAPTGLSAAVAGSTVNLSWTAATDNVGVVRYNVHRSTTSGFTPSTANRIGQPTGTSYADSGVAAGTYYYKVTAEDAAGNVGNPSSEASATVSLSVPTGLVAAYGFDEGSGTSTADQSGNGNTGSLSNTLWSAGGKFGGALSFNGSNARVNVADSASLHLTTGMTLEAWVKPTSLSNWSTVVFKERTGYYAEALYANTDNNRPSANVFTSGDNDLRGTAQLALGTWTHLAATYNGSALTLYVNGAATASAAASGSIATNTGALRIGGNSIWGEYFNGLIDEVRVYSRALTATEIQGDMDRSVTPDNTPPAVSAKTPANGAAGINVGSSATATFSEAMRASTVSASTFTLKDPADNVVPATVTYDAATNVANLTPQSALQYGVTYQATVKGGAGGVTDLAGKPLASSVTWSFTTESSPPQVLVVGSAANPFGMYLGEVLRNEGVDAFTTIDASLISPTLLSGFDVVLLGDTSLNASQVSALSGWVNGGGNLIAMRPDKQLAGLLGLSDARSTLANAYLKVDTSGVPGAGIVGSTIQFHGTADRYTLNGATAVASLYSNATTATANPAVTLRAVGSNGGEAAAFTFDLARSVVYTRQGNPAWAGQERDGVVAVRPDDMFYGAKAGDVQPDWLDTSKIAIPQADEQQRLLVNLMTLMERDRMPLPHFWHLPRGKKAVVILSGDDHSP